MEFSHKLDITFIQRLPQTKPINFSDLIIPLASITTMSELCFILEHLPSFNDLNMITDINIFKSPIKPLWEDEDNLAGGKYIIKVRRVVGQRLFEKLVVNFMNCDYVNGIVASIRKQQVMLSVWVRTVPVEKRVYVQKIRDVLDLGYEALIEFKDNDESLKDNSSFRNTAVFGRIEEEALNKNIAGLRITNDDKSPPKTITPVKKIESGKKQSPISDISPSMSDVKNSEATKKEKPVVEEKFQKNVHKPEKKYNSAFDESKIVSEGQQYKYNQNFPRGNNRGHFKPNNLKKKTFKNEKSTKNEVFNTKNEKLNEKFKEDKETDRNINN